MTTRPLPSALEAAMKLYAIGEISAGAAAKFAGISRETFLAQADLYGVADGAQEPLANDHDADGVEAKAG